MKEGQRCRANPTALPLDSFNVSIELLVSLYIMEEVATHSFPLVQT